MPVNTLIAITKFNFSRAKIKKGFCCGIGITLLILSFSWVQKETYPAFLHSVIRKPMESVRILCWVMTSPETFAKKAVHVRATWGRRCNKLLFMSSENDTEPGVIALPKVPEGYDWLWIKTQEAFRYIWIHHRNDADWFLKADDDTYVILENLRHFLWKQNYLDPIFFGCRFHSFDKEYKNGFMSGGAGYVLSKEAVRRFAAVPRDHKCFKTPDWNEDDEKGKCLEDVGVVAGDSRDKRGRHRFMPLSTDLVNLPKGNGSFWYWGHSFYAQEEKKECCSDTAIGFHYIVPTEMHLMEYLVYRLKPFGFPVLSSVYNPYS